MVHHQTVRHDSHGDQFSRVTQEILEGSVVIRHREKWAFSRTSVTRVIENAPERDPTMSRHSIADARKCPAGLRTHMSGSDYEFLATGPGV